MACFAHLLLSIPLPCIFIRAAILIPQGGIHFVLRLSVCIQFHIHSTFVSFLFRFSICIKPHTVYHKTAKSLTSTKDPVILSIFSLLTLLILYFFIAIFHPPKACFQPLSINVLITTFNYLHVNMILF